MVLDNGTFRKAKKLKIPDNIKQEAVLKARK
jgi:hypothetical protein